MRFTFEVTDDDIAGATRASPCDCPIARAVCRTLGFTGGYGEIDVDAEGVWLAGISRLRRASGPLPCVARRFLDDFDAGRPVEPIRFRLGIRNWFIAGAAPLGAGAGGEG